MQFGVFILNVCDQTSLNIRFEFCLLGGLHETDSLPMSNIAFIASLLPNTILGIMMFQKLRGCPSQENFEFVRLNQYFCISLYMVSLSTLRCSDDMY